MFPSARPLLFLVSLFILPLLLSTFAIAASVSVEQWGDSATLRGIVNRGVLRGGVALAAPYSFKDPVSGELGGVVVEIAREAARRLGVKLEFFETGWDTIIAGLQANRYDVAFAGLFETPARKQVIDFVTFGEEGIAFLVRKDNVKINNVEDLAKPGVTIATVTGSGSEQMIKQNFPRATIRSMLSPTGGSGAPPEEVISGRVDAAQFDAILTIAYLQRFPLLKVVPSDAFEKPLFPTPIGLGIRKGDPPFQAFLATVVKELEQAGMIREWKERWSRPEFLLPGP